MTDKFQRKSLAGVDAYDHSRTNDKTKDPQLPGPESTSPSRHRSD